MKSRISRWSEISCGFRLFFFFSVVLAFTSPASAGSGQLTVNPSNINFGSVSVGNSQTQSLTLTNSGWSRLTITKATSSGTGFTLTGPGYPVTLAGGQSVTCNVIFTPQSAGASSGSVAIVYSTHRWQYGGDSRNSTTVTLPVSGVGVTSGQLTTSPANLGFGSVLVGSSQTLAETLTNSGGASVTISAVGATASGFTANGLSLPLILNAGQSASFSVRFSPTSSGGVNGNLAITSNAANSVLNVPLSGTGVTPGQLSASPASLSFGSVNTGSSATLADTLTNSGGSALTISQITPGGTGFSVSGINLPLTLNAAQSVTFNVLFAPQSGGSATGSLAISSSGSNPVLSVSLTGTGTVALAGQLAVGPSAISFGSVPVGTTQTQTGTLSASNAPVTVSSAGVSASQFSMSGIAFPVTIAAGNSISFQVAFAPKASGAASANLTFVSTASNSPAVQTLSGSGTVPQHSVALGWNTSTSSNVAGYNIYRGMVSGGPFTRINSALNTTPFDTDSSVQAGQTYYYVVTAVDSTGAESGYSNQVQAVIPSP